jgi:hypothetical protein
MDLGGLSLVVGGQGACLMSASPHQPAQPVPWVGGLDDQSSEQVLRFVLGERPVVWCGAGRLAARARTLALVAALVCSLVPDQQDHELRLE